MGAPFRVGRGEEVCGVFCNYGVVSIYVETCGRAILPFGVEWVWSFEGLGLRSGNCLLKLSS